MYYMLAPEGQYYNYSGCGNTLNCNHPVARGFILDALRYWVTEMHIDGFRRAPRAVQTLLKPPKYPPAKVHAIAPMPASTQAAIARPELALCCRHTPGDVASRHSLALLLL